MKSCMAGKPEAWCFIYRVRVRASSLQNQNPWAAAQSPPPPVVCGVAC
jgi:hypothetical protein